MVDRVEVKRVYKVGERIVTIRATEQIGAEDCYSMLMRAVLHRFVTAEDVVPPISREIKDAIIRQSLVI
jgi:hypothetical protein